MNNSILFIVSEDWYFLSHRLSLAIEEKKRYVMHPQELKQIDKDLDTKENQKSDRKTVLAAVKSDYMALVMLLMISKTTSDASFL